MTKKIKVHSFDMDDNVFDLPTKIIYFAIDPANSVDSVAVSTEQFAHTREKVGKVDYVVPVRMENGRMTVCSESEASQTVNLKEYQVVNDGDKSFQQFRDSETQDYFLEDLKRAIAKKSFAPSFKDFVEACSCPETVKHVSIVTARGHAPATFVRAFEYMKSIGMIAHVPLVENIYPVSYKGMPEQFRTGAQAPQIAKMNVLAHLLDEVKKTPNEVHFGFSDDDKKTFDTTRSFLEQEVMKGRWPNVSVNIYFTGNKIKERFVIEAIEPEVA